MVKQRKFQNFSCKPENLVYYGRCSLGRVRHRVRAGWAWATGLEWIVL